MYPSRLSFSLTPLIAICALTTSTDTLNPYLSLIISHPSHSFLTSSSFSLSLSLFLSLSLSLSLLPSFFSLLSPLALTPVSHCY
ncbi:hypothetical protein BKA57DRAFT_457134 [Linnemannia elongata]|nr:hypothetical protein BKA57DRAFT_457134 [Linnemannia elongata]